MSKRSHVDDLRGASRLAIEATKSVTELVRAMHVTIGSGPAILGEPLAGPTRLVTDLVYGTISGVTQVVGAGIDRALAELGTLLGESTPGPEREAVLAALNGVLGDYLTETENPLALGMSLRSEGRPLPLEAEALRAAVPDAKGRVVLLVHGSCMSDLQWRRSGHDHGAALASELDVSAVYVRYNSGLHISDNGQELAELLEQLVAVWPTPLRELTLLGHSMGGLVARSACAAAEARAHGWRERLGTLVCLGSPHHGAPLERGGNWIDVLLGATRYGAPLAKLGQIRSAGVTDLRFGNVLDADWRDRDRFEKGADPRTPLPLPDGVRAFAIAGTLTEAPRPELLGDGLVPVESALGQHKSSEFALRFPEERQHVSFGTAHLELLNRPSVYEQIRDWLA
ncbi:MAG: alpha/beta hydrolase [Myxococcales bacterium]|nr:alpha/beta hydrolase [Myxococcales bacterium]